MRIHQIITKPWFCFRKLNRFVIVIKQFHILGCFLIYKHLSGTFGFVAANTTQHQGHDRRSSRRGTHQTETPAFCLRSWIVCQVCGGHHGETVRSGEGRRCCQVEHDHRGRAFVQVDISSFVFFSHLFICLLFEFNISC